MAALLWHLGIRIQAPQARISNAVVDEAPSIFRLVRSQDLKGLIAGLTVVGDHAMQSKKQI